MCPRKKRRIFEQWRSFRQILWLKAKLTIIQVIHGLVRHLQEAWRGWILTAKVRVYPMAKSAAEISIEVTNIHILSGYM
jgi:hypothetical protein